MMTAAVTVALMAADTQPGTAKKQADAVLLAVQTTLLTDGYCSSNQQQSSADIVNRALKQRTVLHCCYYCSAVVHSACIVELVEVNASDCRKKYGLQLSLIPDEG
jgi:hypothetical protein